MLVPLWRGGVVSVFILASKVISNAGAYPIHARGESFGITTCLY